MFIEVNGVKLYYEKQGKGRPLVLLHGNGEDHTIFDQALRLLSKRFCCYAVDSRSHGNSGEGEMHYEAMAADMLALLEALELQDVIFYGFSDGGIVGILAAAQTKRITTLIVSGANLSPKGIKPATRLLIGLLYLTKKDPKLLLMLKEPYISDDTLAKIGANTLVLAGRRDLVYERETRRIADGIPGAELKILPGEGHGTYIIHSEKIAKLIIDYCRY